MKRLHLHIGVKDLDASIRFYSALFGAEPIKTKDDYAKWMLDDPRVNFAISTRVAKGIDHLGVQVDTAAELDELRNNIKAAESSMFDEGESLCCYARSEKSWVKDPSDIAWECYQTMEDIQLFANKTSTESDGSACCSMA